jgi:hypothetical protein
MNSSRTWLYIGIAFIVLILVFFFIGKAFGKSMPPKPVELPPDGSGGGEGGAQLTEAAIQKLTDQLKDDIYSFGTRNSEPYIALLALSNTDFVRVYNDWNARYYNEDKETLKQAIAGEYFSVTSFTFANVKETLMNRFQSLGLS